MAALSAVASVFAGAQAQADVIVSILDQTQQALATEVEQFVSGAVSGVGGTVDAEA